MDARASARNSAHSPRNGACTTHSGPEPTWYTGPTCARSVAMNVPFSPSHSFTLLSKEADNTKRPFGEKHTWRAEEGGGVMLGRHTGPLLWTQNGVGTQ